MKKNKYDIVTTFDIETIGDNFELDRIGLYSEKFAEIFFDYESFFNFIIKKKICHLFAFYGGGFDFLLLLNFFRYNKMFKLVDIIEINGIILSLKINYFGFEFILQDAYFLVRCSLNEFSMAMLGKSKIDIDRRHIENYDEKIRNDYVMNDCKILHDSIIEFKNQIGFLDITISRIALTLFIKNFCTHNLSKYKYPKYFINDMLAWYYGGHVDVYKRFGENLYYYDINSCYGYSMLKLGSIYNYRCYTDKFRFFDDIKGLYQIIIEDNIEAPVIPFRLKSKDCEKIYYLNTRLPFNVTSIDIELLEKLNVKYKILNGYLFDYDREFFKNYIEYWYKQRQESPKLKFISKLMINSLYGKFGQKINRLSTVISDKLDDSQYYDKDLNLGRKETVSINWFNHPEIASWVTSGARFFHSQLIQKYIDNIYYVDTDSIIIDRKADNSEIGIEIGKLKLEYELIERGYFLGSKFYAFYNSKKPLYQKNNEICYEKVVLKGFQEKDFSEKQFINAIYYDDFKFSYLDKSINKFKRSLISFDTYIKYTESLKKISEISLKRKLKPDKINTEPFFLNNNKYLI